MSISLGHILLSMLLGLAHAGPVDEIDELIQEIQRSIDTRKLERARTRLETLFQLLDEADDPAARAEAELLRGLLAVATREPVVATEALAEASELFESLDDAFGLARTHDALGSVRILVNDPERAIEEFETALETFRELDRGVEIQYTLRQLGTCHALVGEFDAALELWEEGAAVADELGLQAERIRVLTSMSQILAGTGQPVRAFALLEECRGIAEQLGNPYLLSKVLREVALVHLSTGALEAAEQALLHSVGISEQAGVAEGTGEACFRLASLTMSMGKLDRSRHWAVRSIDLARQVGSRSMELGSLSMLAEAEFLLGMFESARDSLDECIALAREQVNETVLIKVLRVKGTLLHHLGDEAGALACMEESLELSLRDMIPISRVLAAVTLGDLHLAHGRLDRAESAYQNALDWGGELDFDHNRALALAGLSRVALRQDRADEALQLADQAWSQASEGSEATTGLEVLAVRAATLIATGDEQAAAECALQMLERAEEMGAEAHQLSPLEILAGLALRAGDTAAARSRIERARILLARIQAQDLGIDPAAGFRSRHARFAALEQDLTAQRMQQADDAEQATAARDGFLAAGLWKGRALLEGIVEHRQGGRSRELLDLQRRRRDAQLQRNTLMRRRSEAIREDRPVEVAQELEAHADRLLREAEQLGRRLAELAPRDATLDAPRAHGPEELQRSVLAPGDVLIEFTEGRDRLYAYTLTGDGLRFSDLGDRHELARRVEAYIESISTPDSLGSLGDVTEHGTRLYRELLERPLARLDGPLQRLILVPSASLAALAFEALVVREPAAGSPANFEAVTFVLDRFDVRYAPSSQVLVELAGMSGSGAERRLLVLADPDYAGDLPRLRRSREEALALYQLVEREPPRLGADPEAQSLSLEGDRASALLGQLASTARLAGDLRDHRIIHFAAHGVISRSSPRDSGIELARTGDGSDRLTTADVLDMDLDADLVVLSACSTGRGEVRAGEGVESLARAFLFAGSRSVVASLWDVSDEAALTTMTGFYTAMLQQGRSIPVALRHAKQRMRGRGGNLTLRGVGALRPMDQVLEAPGGHPFFWAPFVYIGAAGQR